MLKLKNILVIPGMLLVLSGCGSARESSSSVQVKPAAARAPAASAKALPDATMRDIAVFAGDVGGSAKVQWIMSTIGAAEEAGTGAGSSGNESAAIVVYINGDKVNRYADRDGKVVSQVMAGVVAMFDPTSGEMVESFGVDDTFRLEQLGTVTDLEI